MKQRLFILLFLLSVPLSGGAQTAMLGRNIPTRPTGTAPTASTSAASSITTTAASLNGSSTPNGFTTTISFEWGTSGALGTPTSTEDIGAGITSVNATPLALSGLTCNTQYFFRLVATNINGSTAGSTLTFTTSSCAVAPTAPAVITGIETNVTTTSATLHGTANPNGSPTTGYYEWGLTVSYGTTTVPADLGSGVGVVSIGSPGITGLTCATTYHYRAVATNAGGTTNGSDDTLTTSTCPAAGRQLLTSSDFTYDNCYWNINTDGGGVAYYRGFTGRYVAGDLRFLYLAWVGSSSTTGAFDEFSITGKACASSLSTGARTGRWTPTAIGHTSEQWAGIEWDEAGQKLWSMDATSYTSATFPWYALRINTRTLNADGLTAENAHGPVGLFGVPAKRVGFGSILFIPAEWQTDYGFEPYMLFGGGYTSRAAQEGVASFGATAYGIPDVAGYSAMVSTHDANDPNLIPAGSISTYADHYLGTLGNPSPSRDRGSRRDTVSFNNMGYYEAGDPRNNPLSGTWTISVSGSTLTNLSAAPRVFQTWWAGYSITDVNSAVQTAPPFSVTVAGVSYPVVSVAANGSTMVVTGSPSAAATSLSGPSPQPVVPPAGSSNWKCPDAATNNECRWSWGDSYWDTANLLNGTNRYGIFAVASLTCGKSYYANSRLNNTATCFEIHVFDPADLKAVKDGSLQPYNVQPRVMIDITGVLPGTGQASGGLEVARNMIGGAWFDSSTKKLYILFGGVSNGSNGRLYRFTVADNP